MKDGLFNWRERQLDPEPESAKQVLTPKVVTPKVAMESAKQVLTPKVATDPEGCQKIER